MISYLLVAGLLVAAPAAPAVEPKPEPKSTEINGDALRLYIAKCEKLGGYALVTVSKNNRVALGCVKAGWDVIEVPE